jgi:micrococcal nuclease
MNITLAEATNENVAIFSLNNKTFKGKVVSIHDGDTCKIVLDIDGKLAKFNCRLNGIDTPEMKPKKTDPNRDKIKASAIAARDRLRSLCQELVDVECFDFDKYGRLLVHIHTNGKNVNNILIEEGFAYAYNGGTKRS